MNMRQHEGFKFDSSYPHQRHFFFICNSGTTDSTSVCQDAKHTIRKGIMRMHSLNRVQDAKA